jgi:hypothetical protein
MLRRLFLIEGENMDGLMLFYDDELLQDALEDILYYTGLDSISVDDYNGIVKTLVNYAHAKILEEKLDQVDEYIKKVM